MPKEREQAQALFKDKPTATTLLVMGLFQYYKWDKINAREKVAKRELTCAEIEQICDDFTDTAWLDFHEDAEATLRTFTENNIKTVVEANFKTLSEAISVLNKQPDKWLVPIAQGVIAAFIYSIILVVTLLIIKYNGVDVLHAFGIEPKG